MADQDEPASSDEDDSEAKFAEPASDTVAGQESCNDAPKRFVATATGISATMVPFEDPGLSPLLARRSGSSAGGAILDTKPPPHLQVTPQLPPQVHSERETSLHEGGGATATAQAPALPEASYQSTDTPQEQNVSQPIEARTQDEGKLIVDGQSPTEQELSSLSSIEDGVGKLTCSDEQECDMKTVLDDLEAAELAQIEMQKEMAKLKKQVVTLRREKRRLVEENKELTKEYGRQREKWQAKLSEKEKLLWQKHGEMDRQPSDMEKQLLEKDVQVAQKDKELTEANSLLQQKEEEIQTIRTHLAETQEKLTRCEADNASLEDEKRNMLEAYDASSTADEASHQCCEARCKAYQVIRRKHIELHHMREKDRQRLKEQAQEVTQGDMPHPSPLSVENPTPPQECRLVQGSTTHDQAREATDGRVTVLIEKHLPELLQVLGKNTSIAFQLGLQLGLDPGVVKGFKTQANGDTLTLLTYVLSSWLQRINPPTTVEALATAIEKLPGGLANPTLAQKVRTTKFKHH